MFSSSILILSFIGVVNFALSAANPGRHQIENLDTEKTTYGDGINFGKRVGKTNELRLEEQNKDSNYPNTRSRSKSTSRLGSEPQATPNQETNYRHNSYNNVGNGFGNTNIVVTENGDDELSYTQSANAKGYNSGTSFVLNREDGVDHFNVGYGSNNQNNIIHTKVPSQPESTGSNKASPHDVIESLITLKQISDELQEIVTKLIQEQNACITQ